MSMDEPAAPALQSVLCFDCAARIASRSWPLVGTNGLQGIPDIPRLVDGLCSVCEGSRPLDPKDIEG